MARISSLSWPEINLSNFLDGGVEFNVRVRYCFVGTYNVHGNNRIPLYKYND